MLLSITIDTTHPDAQGDARTAIKLLQDTFNLYEVSGEVTMPHDSVMANLSEILPRQQAEARTATPQPPEPMAEARGAVTPPVTPDAQAHAHADPATASQAAAITPSSARALIPGTDTYVPIDVNGLPWDKRIHASSQGRTADGSWRRKPKVPEVDFQRVAAELRRIMSAPAAEAAEDTPPPVSPAEAFAQPPAAHAESAEEPMGFAAFATWAGTHVHHQRLRYADMERVMRELGLVNAEGVGSFALLAHRPDLIPSAHERLSALIAAGDSP